TASCSHVPKRSLIHLGSTYSSYRSSGFHPLLSVQNSARRHHAGLQIAPQGDQQLAGHRDDGDAPDATLAGPDTLSEPDTQRAVGLMTKPQPGQLDHTS